MPEELLPQVIYDSYLLDDSGEANLVMGSAQPEQLIWTLHNNQPQDDLVVTPFKSGGVSPQQYHFVFNFSPGALTQPPTLTGWDVLAVPDGHGAIGAVYVALTGTPLRIPPGNRHMTALVYPGAIQENANSTNIGVTLTANDNVMLGKHSLKGSSIGPISLTLVKAKAVLSAPPLALDFVGRRTVLNDGETPNNFTFALTNMTPADLTLTPEVKFTVWFAAAPNQGAGGFPWALARVDDLATTTLKLAPPGSDADWSVNATPTALAQDPVSRQWEFAPKRTLVLAAQNSVEFTFSGLKTDLDPGFTRMYLRFMNLPGFRPGVLSAVLEKTPLNYGASRGQGLYLSGGIPQGNLPPTPSFASGLYVQQFNAGAAAAIFNGGPVGIGTGAASPSAMLQVNDSSLFQNLFSGVTTLGILQRASDTVGLSVRAVDHNPTLQFCGYDENGKNGFCNYVELDKGTGDFLIGGPNSQTRFNGNNIITGGNITAGNITGSNINGSNVTGGTINGTNITGTNITGGNITASGKLTASGLALNGGMTVAGKGTVIELGYGVPGKQGDAGKIGYQIWTTGLDIVGATSDNKRQIHLFDEVYVHGHLWQVYQDTNSENTFWCSLGAHSGRVGQGSWDYATFTAPSDVRLKTNIARLESPLARLKTLNGCAFDWTADALSLFTKDAGAAISAGPDAPAEQTEALRRAERERAIDALARRQVGVIAQEVEAVLPEAVTTGEDGYKSVNYQPLVALLIEAVKEQDVVVTAQAARIDRLQSQIDRLTEMLEELQTQAGRHA